MSRGFVHYVFMGFPWPSEAFARMEVLGLLEAGCRVSVSTFRPPHRRARELLREHTLDDVPVSHGSAKNWLRGLAAVFRHPRTAIRVVSRTLAVSSNAPRQCLTALLLVPRALGIALEIRARNPDRLHLFWGHYPSLVALALKELGCRTPVSMFLGAYDLVLRFPLSRELARDADVTTHARVNVPDICRFTGLAADQVRVIHRGIRVRSMPDAGRRSKRPLVLATERLVKAKRTCEVVRLFGVVRDSVPGATLVILGDGPERRNLEKMVSDLGLDASVVMRGHVSHADVHREMMSAHVLVSMTQSPGERLPNAVKEAMAAGCPVVVARSPGIEELVTDGETGYILRPGDIQGAAARVVELLTRAERHAEIARRAYWHVAQAFDIAETTRQRIEFWRFGAVEKVDEA